MCWPSLEGGIEIEERRRKHKNGPRRKRLHFVKDRSSGHSDEWQLIHPRPHHDPPEMWEQPQPQQHPPPGYDPHWAAHLQQQQQQQHIQQQMHNQQQQIPAPPLHHQNGWQPHPHHGHEDEIFRVEEFHPEPQHNGHHQLSPRVIEAQPRVARMPSHLRARSRSRVRGHSRGGSGTHSLFSDDSSYRGRRRGSEVFNDDDSFVEPRRTVRRVVATTRRRVD